ncbi:hypothetical protein GCM10027268_09070 [Brachybacterium huguangmaarense]
MGAMPRELRRAARPGPGDSDAPAPSGPASSGAGSTFEERLARLERTVERLANAGADPDREGSPSDAPRHADAAATAASADDPLFLLHAIEERVPAPGAVFYAGTVELPIGPVTYQWGRPTQALLDADWAERAERVAALGHPLRLAMLRLLLDAEHTVAQIVDELDLGSTGVAYHHLNQLHGAGWITSPRRGVWAIPPSRVIPLLAIVTALEEG